MFRQPYMKTKQPSVIFTIKYGEVIQFNLQDDQEDMIL